MISNDFIAGVKALLGDWMSTGGGFAFGKMYSYALKDAGVAVSARAGVTASWVSDTLIDYEDIAP